MSCPVTKVTRAAKWHCCIMNPRFPFPHPGPLSSENTDPGLYYPRGGLSFWSCEGEVGLHMPNRLSFAEIPQPYYAGRKSPFGLCSIYFLFHFKIWISSEGKPIHVLLICLHLIFPNGAPWHPWASHIFYKTGNRKMPSVGRLGRDGAPRYPLGFSP